uniref:(northern house mosquito) hypothetical protein n=1 Tax=Culex pipiens TaxID=7175 RepID=A0A8D8J8Z4_CULPI
MIIIASLFFFFSENPLNPDFASSIPYGPYTPAQSPDSCSKVCLRHKTLLYSIVRLFQSLFSKNLVIFFQSRIKLTTLSLCSRSKQRISSLRRVSLYAAVV